MITGPLFINADVLHALRHAEQHAPNVDQVMAFTARVGDSEEDGAARVLRVIGSVAEISVVGVLTARPDLFASLFGGGNTAYSDIRAAFKAAALDPVVKRVLLKVESPGGTIQGLFETIGAIQAFTKPVDVLASMACSAAYALATATGGRITATNPAAAFGSAGTVSEYFVDPRMVSIANTDSPKKRPDVTTPAGQAMVRETLDAYFELFVDAIAQGRKTTPEKVKTGYGQGAILLARDAKKRGMIDRVAPAGAALPGSEMEAAERMIEHFAAVDAGKYPRRAGESTAQFEARMSAVYFGEEDTGPSPNVDTSGRDAGDLVADALGLPPLGQDLGDQIAAKMAASRGKVFEPEISGKDAGDLVADALGLPPAEGDIGDQIAARMSARRAGHSASKPPNERKPVR